jgi:hypothetical protein
MGSMCRFPSFIHCIGVGSLVGCAFLVVPPEKQPSIEPLVASSFRGQGFEKEFRYTGMFEASTWVSVIQVRG